jgi:glycerol-3-phosphate O-acyltransferase
LRAQGPTSELELKSSVATLVRALEENGARIYVPRSDWDYAVAAGLRMLVLRHLVLERDGLFVASVDERPLLRYYANSIRHLLPETLRP